MEAIDDGGDAPDGAAAAPGEECLSLRVLPEGMAVGVDRQPRLAGERTDEGRIAAVEGRTERVERRPVGRRDDRADVDSRAAHTRLSAGTVEMSTGSPSCSGLRAWISAKASITRWTSSRLCMAESVTRTMEVLIGTAG